MPTTTKNQCQISMNFHVFSVQTSYVTGPLVVSLFLESSARNLITYCTLRTPAAERSVPAGDRIDLRGSGLASCFSDYW